MLDNHWSAYALFKFTLVRAINRKTSSRIAALCFILLSGVGSVAIFMLGLTHLVEAYRGMSTLCVVPMGDPTGPYPACDAVLTNIQTAVDQVAPGGEIRIAAGVYTGTQQRNGITQTVYISKAVTLAGGYIAPFTNPPTPNSQPTILNAEGNGRVITIEFADNVTISGVELTGGDATGLGGSLDAEDPPVDYGGGLFALHSQNLHISNCRIVENVASERSERFDLAGAGGGLAFDNSLATIANCYIAFNNGGVKSFGLGRNSGIGGGIRAQHSTVSITNNTLENNVALYASRRYERYASGGAISTLRSQVFILNNVISGNVGMLTLQYITESAGIELVNAPDLQSSAHSNHGLVSTSTHLASYSPPALSRFTNPNTPNTHIPSGEGGGLDLTDSKSTISGNLLENNTVIAFTESREHGRGGAINIRNSASDIDQSIVIVGNQIRHNVAISGYGWAWGGGLFVAASGPSQTVQIDANIIENNLAAAYETGGVSDTLGFGGGVWLELAHSAVITVTDNIIEHNRAAFEGDGHSGGMAMIFDDLSPQRNAIVTGNRIGYNIASSHGFTRSKYAGLYLMFANVFLANNIIEANEAAGPNGFGGGLTMMDCVATLVNTVVIDNYAGGYGSPGIVILNYYNPTVNAVFSATHTTVARNVGGRGVGFSVNGNSIGDPFELNLVNTIVSNQAIGIGTWNEVALEVESILWHSTVSPVHALSSGLSLTMSNSYFGDPNFMADGYHIGIGDAKDRGVATTFVHDIDGELRVLLPDLGADELRNMWLGLPAIFNQHK